VRSAKATISDLEYPPSPEPWVGFWIRDFVVRSFRQSTAVYEAANDDVFPPDSLAWYATLGNSLPQPLASLSDGQVGFSLREGQKATVTFLQHASAWVMLRCLLEQITYEKLLVCPVLEGQYQDFLQEMSIHPYCPKGVAEGGCGRVEIGADISDHPARAFRLLVTDIGLASSSGHVAYHP